MWRPKIKTHITDHNKVRQALIDLNSLAGQANVQADNYTLVLTDAGKTIEMTKATVSTLTVPLNSSVAFPVGTRIDILQVGAGQVTVAAATGAVTINYKGGLKISGQWAAATLIKRATDTWVLIGNLTA
jgi:hypothetical protein